MYTHFVMLICTVKCCALCITESDLFLVPKNRGFLKTELLWKPNFRDGPEAVRFSQIILYNPFDVGKDLRQSHVIADWTESHGLLQQDWIATLWVKYVLSLYNWTVA